MPASLAQSQGLTRRLWVGAVGGKHLLRMQRRQFAGCALDAPGRLRESSVPGGRLSLWLQRNIGRSAYGPTLTMRLRWFSSKAAEGNINPETAATNLDIEGADIETAETSREHDQPQTLSNESQLEEEIKSLKDQLLRSLAEQENTRRIAQRDVDAARQFAIKSFAKSLLDVSDNLGRALEAVPTEEILESKEGTRTLATLYEGIEMTERGLKKAFELHGLVKYGIVGELFDPNQHEALYEYSDPSKAPGTIGQVMKSGFLLNNRVLRPAEVAVVRKEKE